MEIGYVSPKKITEEMEECYLDYAMSVIVSRALPDARDGLKPVHRRILYAMHTLGLHHTASFRKSATVVGEVLGKYHPHGDTAVYDAAVRLAQDFSIRYPLINGQGNFGSMDGDSAAAMRYTEAKLSMISEEMLIDIDKNTVDFADNYDKSQKEPTVMPAKIPQLLLNGTMGIAVGMATNIPPHNLNELSDALVCLVENPETTIEDLMNYVKGPDFPTGGMIYDNEAIKQAYATGKGGIVIRAKAEITETKANKFRIIISEMVYQVNKSSLIEHIANLVKEKKVEGIKELRDESDKKGVRVVIELKNDAYPKKVLNRLFQLTDLQKSFHFNMLSLVDGIQPRVLSLKMMLEIWLEHRREIIKRRSQFLLDKAKERAHILEGLSKALSKIDAIIKTIKASPTKEKAKENLIKKFKFTVRQTEAILEMKLQTLAGLERKKIEEELLAKKKEIKELTAILKSKEKVSKIIKEELEYIKQKYGDERRTKVFKNKVSEFAQEDFIPNEAVMISLTEGGYIKRLSPSTYRSQSRGGKGVIGAETKKGEDIVKFLFTTQSHNNLLFFTNRGRVFQSKSYEIPEASRTARGHALVNFLQLAPNEVVKAILPISAEDYQKSASGYIILTTKNGLVKKTKIEDFKNVRRSGLLAIKFKQDDELRWAHLTSGKDEIISITAQGKAIHFQEKDVRSMGRTAAGVRAIRLRKNDEVIGMEIIKVKSGKSKVENENRLLIVTENGFGKTSKVNLFKIQRRGGSGLAAAKVTPKTGKIVSSRLIGQEEKEDLLIISQNGQVIRIPLKTIPSLGRSTQGVRIMRLKENDKVASVSLV
jgi:DNA gyrase subunit A